MFKAFNHELKLVVSTRSSIIMPFYAVARGRNTGIFNSWSECEDNIKNYSNAKYKKFSTINEAREFVSSHAATGRSNSVSDSHANHFVNDLTSFSAPNTLMRSQKCRNNDIVTHDIKPTVPTTSALSSASSRASSKRVKVEPKDESMVIANVNALDASFSDFKEEKFDPNSVSIIKVGDPDQICVESVSIDPEEIFEPREKHVFVVIDGKCPGIYKSMAEAWKQIDGQRNCFVKAFKDEDDAQFFLDTYKNSPNTSSFDPHSLPPGNNSRDNQINSHIDVWTDGACEANGRTRAVAGIGVYYGRPDDPRNVSEPLLGRQTNNRAEIHAAIRAIRDAKDGGYKSVTIHTDSQFLINSITKWVQGWIRRGWTLSSGGPVVNKDDFIELLDVMKGINVQWVKVDAHSGDVNNDYADQLAKEGINRPLVTASSWNNSPMINGQRSINVR